MPRPRRSSEALEAALRESEDRMRAVLDASLDAVILVDVHGRVSEFNRAAEAMFGRTREEAIGLPFADLILPAARHEGHFEQLRHFRETGEAPFLGELYELDLLRADGTEFPAQARLELVERAGQTQFVGFFSDRSELQRSEEQARRLEEQLRQSQKMEAIGSLAGGIAHDFNNLLMVVQLAAADLGRRSGDPREHDSVTLIRETVKRATGLTRQLLAFSRQQVLHPQRTDVNEVVRDELALLARVLGEDIVISARLADELSPILADQTQLAQVVLNLAVNARDAMPRGGRLTVETADVTVDEGYAAGHLEITPGRYVLLSVTDDGIGMDEETRMRAFEPFFTTKEGGTGFGLATVYGVVRQTGGHVWLYSEPGVGTTFKLYFPVLAGDASIEVPQPPAEPDRAGGPGAETILLVEDEPALRPIIARMLEGEGYTVLQASDAEEALELAGTVGDGIDLLITDVVMPGLNGRELAERLQVEHPGLRVLFSSGYPADTILRHGIEQSTVRFLEKPYGPEELLREVRRILDVPAA